MSAAGSASARRCGKRCRRAEFAPLPLADAFHRSVRGDRRQRRAAAAGLVYGAGIGRFHKPHFFLGRLARSERHDGLTVLVCDCEYARDLTAIPAALQGDTVIVRREALRQWLWEKAEAWGMKQKPGAMARALAAYGYDDDPAAALARMTDRETETLILHERGEHAAGQLLGPDWEDMIAGFTRRRAELLARAVRDNLADCLFTLPALIERDDRPRCTSGSPISTACVANCFRDWSRPTKRRMSSRGRTSGSR